MTEKGTIKSIDNDKIVIGCGDSGACKSCGSSGFCSVKERTYEAVNNRDLDLSEGDVVTVFLPPGQTVFAAFLVMIVPLLLFVLGFILSGRIFSGAGEGLKVLCGLAGLCLGFLTSFLYSRRASRARFPQVVSVVSKQGTGNSKQLSVNREQ